MSFRFLLIGMLVLGCTAQAEEAAPLEVSEAEPAPEPMPSPEAAPESTGEPAPPTVPDVMDAEAFDIFSTNEEITLNYEGMFSANEGRSIAEEIQIELLDLDSLMATLNEYQRERVVRLTLGDCIQLGLAQNPDIVIAGLEPLMAEADVQAASGEFDPQLSLDARYTDATVSLSTQQVAFGGIEAIQSYNTTVNAQIAGKLSTGAMYGIIFNSTKDEDTFGQFITDFNTQTTLTLTQPLLRGFGVKYNRVRIRAARNNVRATEAQLKLTAMTAVAEIVKAYWDLVGAVQAVQVSQASLDNARRLMKVNETRREIGTAADIEVLSAKTGVATRQSDLITARSRVGDASDRLKQLLDLREGDRFSQMIILPVDRPNTADNYGFDPEAYEEALEGSIAKALERRPELEIAAIQIENAELDEYRSRRDMLPQFDITGNFGQGGRDEKLRDALNGMRDGDDEIWGYGFQASVPIGNRAARGAYRRSKLTTRQAELREAKQRTDIMAMVNLMARGVLTNQTLIASNEQAVRLQEAEVAAEEQRLQLGVTTSWQVLQVQEQLTGARTALLQSEVAYEKALIDLQLAEGTLLENLEITVTPPDDDYGEIGYFRSLNPIWK
jgi:outer membrane protein TolC